MSAPDYIQIVTFRLDGLEPEAYAAHCESIAPRFTEQPGLRSKIWLADAEGNAYGGVYRWAGREAMRDYVEGPIFAALLESPAFAEVTSRAFAVLPGPTRITA